VSYILSEITIGIDPTIEIGPVTLAWHGLTMALGILIGAVAAARVLRERGLDPANLSPLVGIIAVAGLVGGKLFFLAEQGTLGDPAEWFDSNGFTFNGGFVLATAAIAVYVWRRGLSVAYVDAIATGFPLGVAIGRIGDVINGEHYGPESSWLLAVRNTHPDADVPSTAVAYHSGGLYEVMLAVAILAIVWPLRHRITQPLAMVWLVSGLFAAGRFFEFFYRSDSDEVALGLNSAQWTSLAILAVSVAGWRVTSRLEARREPQAGAA
jgi:phosphatidylglycerol:prolipoprotein diacylglycerol transferase